MHRRSAVGGARGARGPIEEEACRRVGLERPDAGNAWERSATATWPYRRVTDAQCERLHRAAVSILERTGVRLELPRAVELLRGAGARVDADGIVRIPADLVDWALERAPRAASRSSTRPARRRWSSTASAPSTAPAPTASTCSTTAPARGASRRWPTSPPASTWSTRCPTSTTSCRWCCRPTSTTGSPTATRCARCSRARASRSCSSPTRPRAATTPWRWPRRWRAGPRRSPPAPSSPATSTRRPGLLHNADALEKTIFLAERGIPILYIPGSQAGVTGPATPAGAVAHFWAGVLTGIVLAQVVQGGRARHDQGLGRRRPRHEDDGLRLREPGPARDGDRPEPLGRPAELLAGRGERRQDGRPAGRRRGGPHAGRRVARRARRRPRPRLPRVGAHVLVRPARDLRRDRRLAAPPAGAATTPATRRWRSTSSTRSAPTASSSPRAHTMRHFRELYYPSLFERATYEAWREKDGGTLAERAGRPRGRDPRRGARRPSRSPATRSCWRSSPRRRRRRAPRSESVGRATRRRERVEREGGGGGGLTAAAPAASRLRQRISAPRPARPPA